MNIEKAASTRPMLLFGAEVRGSGIRRTAHDVNESAGMSKCEIEV